MRQALLISWATGLPIAFFTPARPGQVSPLADATEKPCKRSLNYIFIYYRRCLPKNIGDKGDRARVNDTEQYEFDRQGYIVIPGFLSPSETARLADAVESLLEHAVNHVALPPRKLSAWGSEHHADAELGYHARGEAAADETIIIEDFWNADPAFDFLVDHGPTMEYIRAIVAQRPTINNSEIRVRYRGNASRHHGGRRPETQKYRYSFTDGRIDCMMVRMIYFVHDVTADQGAFTVLPGTHKSELPCPYGTDPDTEPGTVSLEMKAGDAILFTEALRHGGRSNRSDQVRKTIHVGYGPYWMRSQNVATMDESQHLLPSTLDRWTPSQRDLFRAWPDPQKQG